MDPGSQVADDVLYEITWRAFYFAADTLLDMLLYIQKDNKESLKPKNKVPTTFIFSTNLHGDLKTQKKLKIVVN